ncbi:hypothetical protein HQ403_01155 [Candidatus Kaiserbacteria bacterium]|nr:hypothetical protein [Candidatus Kaiserbacteria bacterium]
MRHIILASIFSLFLIGAVFLVSPNASYAAEPLVQCGGTGQLECSLCELAKLAERVINFIVQVSFVIAALLFAIAGAFYFTAGGDPGRVSSAHKILKDTVIGIIIILTAWLVVNVILAALTKEGGLNPFTSVLCQNREHANEFQGINTPSDGSSSLQATGSKKDTPTQPKTNCSNCTLLSSSILTNGNACKSGVSGCFVEKELNNRLLSLQERAATPQYNLSAGSWQVSEAWPPTVEHKAACHYNATCVDVSFTKTATRSPKNVQSFIDAAAGSQLRAVYEVSTEARKEQLSSQGVTSVIVVPTITGEHFSVYKVDSIQGDTEASKEQAGEFSQ